ncbi:MAG: hypothetical protein ACREQM_06760 [Candidatus Dormibacteraceae bacterium]
MKPEEFLRQMLRHGEPVDPDEFDGRVPDAGVLDFVSLDDRTWFETHRGEQSRLRPAQAGEWPMLDPPAEGAELMVKVFRVAKDIRVRAPAYWAMAEKPEGGDDDR